MGRHNTLSDPLDTVRVGDRGSTVLLYDEGHGFACTSPMGSSWLEPPSLSGKDCWLARRRLLSDVQSGVRDHRVQGAQRGATVRSPVVHVRVLPPPQRLSDPAGFIVLKAVDQVSRNRRQII